MATNYDRTVFVNGSEPAINAENLNKITAFCDAIASGGAGSVVKADAADAATTVGGYGVNELNSLAFFRTWEPTRSYAINEPAFHNGIPYKSLVGSNTNNVPATSPSHWEVTGGGGGGTVNYLLSDLTKGKSNVTDVGVTSSWNASETSILSTGALQVVVPGSGTGRYIDINLKPLNANNVGQQWSIKLSYKLDTAADDLVSFFLFDGTTETPTTLSSLPYAGGTMQTVSGAVYPTTTLSNVRLRARFKDSTACTLYLADLTVGPFNPYGGAAIGNWMDYTPTFVGIGTPTSISCRYRRVGSSLEVLGRITTGGVTATPMEIRFPLGLTQISYNTLAPIVGQWWQNSSASGVVKRGVLRGVESTNYVLASVDEINAPTSPFIAPNANAIMVGTTVLAFQFSVPIAQWTSNINLVQDFQEFASHDGSTIFYGVNGATIPTSTPASTSESLDLNFNGGIQSSDMFVYEMQPGGSGPWVTSGGSIHDPFSFDGTNGVGAGLRVLSGTIRLVRGKYARGGSVLWSTIPAGTRWRVRKISNGNMAEFDTRKLDGSVNVTGNYTVGNEQTVNVEAATANITIPAGLPIGTRKTIRKLHATTTSSVNILRSGTDVFTSASLTTVPIFGNGSFWIIEKVTSTRWELVGGSDYVIGSGVTGNYTKRPDGSVIVLSANIGMSAGADGPTNGFYYKTITWSYPLTVVNKTATWVEILDSNFHDAFTRSYDNATPLSSCTLVASCVRAEGISSKSLRAGFNGRWY